MLCLRSQRNEGVVVPHSGPARRFYNQTSRDAPGSSGPPGNPEVLGHVSLGSGESHFTKKPHPALEM